MLLIHKLKSGCTNKKMHTLTCTNDPESLCSKLKNGGSIVSLVLIYKHKTGRTNEKNACTNDALTILRVWTQNSKMAGEMYLSSNAGQLTDR